MDPAMAAARDEAERTGRIVGVCSVAGCTRATHARGLCDAHYRRWKRGRPFDDPFRDTKRGWSINKDGYVVVFRPGHPAAVKGGYALEHRVVWHDHRGPIPAGYQVHHKDHNRSNNDIANLELKTPAEHAEEHNQPGMPKANKYGSWIIAGDTKTCQACGETKSVDDFYKRGRDGRPSSACKRCTAARTRLYKKPSRRIRARS